MKNYLTSKCYSLLTRAFFLSTFFILLVSRAGANETESEAGNTIAGIAQGGEIEKMVYIFTPLIIIALAVLIRTIKLLLSHEQHS